MDENKIDQTPLAEAVSEKIPYKFAKYFLVKPLEVETVKKEISRPIKTETVEEDGMDITDYNGVEKVIEEVPSEYTKGIVLKIPHEYSQMLNDENIRIRPILTKVGDTIVYKTVAGRYFDLCKDTQLVAPYDIVGIVE